MHAHTTVDRARSKLYRLLVLVGTCLALLAPLTITSVVASLPPAAAQGPSSGDTVHSPDPTTDAARSPSLALTADDRPIVAYRNATGPGVKILICDDQACDPNAGNFGDSILGNIDLVTGQESVLAMDGVKPFAIYEDFATDELKTVTCHDSDCAIFTTATLGPKPLSTRSLDVAVNSAGVPAIVYSGSDGVILLQSGTATVIETGSFVEASIEFDGNDVPVVAYFELTSGIVKVAHCGDAVCSSPSIQTVDTVVVGTAGWNQMDFELDANDRPVLAYGSSLDLRVALCENPTCSLVTVETPIAGSTGTPWVHDLEIDPATGQPVMAFTHENSSFLWVLRCDDTRCTSALSHVHSVLRPQLVNQIGEASLEIDSQGNPVIAYQDVSSHNLHILRCDDPLCAAPAAPIVTNVSFQSTVDTCNGTAIVPVTVDMFDVEGNFDYVGARFRSPGGTTTSEFVNVAPGQTAATAVIDLQFQPLTEVGTWQLEQVWVYDLTGQASVYDTAQIPGPNSIEVLPCPSAPSVHNVFMQSIVDTCAADAVVPVTIEVVDDDGDLARVEMALTSPTGNFVLAEFANLTSGPTFDSVTIPFTFPQGSEPGYWPISYLEVHDATGVSTVHNWPGGIDVSPCNPACTSNDELSCAEIVTSGPLPQSVAGTSVGSTVDGIEQGSLCAAGPLGGSVWYAWVPGFTGRVAIDTFGSDFDTVLDIAASTGTPYTHTHCSDDVPPSLQSSLQADVIAGNTVWIRVSGRTPGIEGVVQLTISELVTGVIVDFDGDGVPDDVDNCVGIWNPGQIDDDGDLLGNGCDLPKGLTVAQGSVWDGLPISYLGCPNGTVEMTIDGYTFTLTEVTPGAYEYQLQEFEVFGGSYTILFTVSCPDGSTVNETFDATLDYLDPSGLILDQLGRPIEGATVTLLYSDVALTDANDAGFTIVPDGSTIMSPANRMNPMPSRFDGFYRWDTIEGWFVVAATAPTCVNPDGSGPEVRSAVLPVPPEQFHIDLVLECELDGCEDIDYFECAIEIAASPLPQAISGSSVDATEQPAEVAGSCVASDAASNSVWWSWTPTTTEAVRAATLGSDFDTVLTVWTGPALASLAETACNDDAPGTTGELASELTFVATAGTTYWFQMHGYSPDASGQVELSLSQTCALDGYVGFTDVAPDDWFADEVQWAACDGITKGTSDTTFSPTDLVTRAQWATLLWRFADEPAHTDDHSFVDVPDGKYFTDAVGWLAETGITTGTSDTTFSPFETVSRAQLATFLWRFNGSPPGSPANQFVDVPSVGWYTLPVDWLAETGITTGTSDTTFSPDDPLTRAQAVTFLSRLALLSDKGGE